MDLSQKQFPPVFGVSTLSALIEKAPASILADRSRAPHRVPPACTPPGAKQPLWILDDVITWLRQHQEPQQPVPGPVAAPEPILRRRGRPPKAEQARRAAAVVAQKGGE